MREPRDPSAPPGEPRGFARLSPEQRSAVSSKGGKTAQATGKANRWTHESAKAAGRKGGLAYAARIRELREKEER